MILQGVRRQKPYIGICYANNPKKGGYTTLAPALDLTTSLRGDLCSCAFGANIRSYTKQRALHGTPFLQTPPPPSFGGRPCQPPPRAPQSNFQVALHCACCTVPCIESAVLRNALCVLCTALCCAVLHCACCSALCVQCPALHTVCGAAHCVCCALHRTVCAVLHCTALCCTARVVPSTALCVLCTALHPGCCAALDCVELHTLCAVLCTTLLVLCSAPHCVSCPVHCTVCAVRHCTMLRSTAPCVLCCTAQCVLHPAPPCVCCAPHVGTV